MKKIHVVGCPGSGKSTFASSIAETFELVHVELDALFHMEDWRPRDDHEFRDAVSQRLQAAQEGLVVDGLYSSTLQDIVKGQIDTLIFLDIPLRKRLPRVIVRSIRRILKRELLWGRNRESLKGAYGLIRFMILHAQSQRAKILRLSDGLDENQRFMHFRSNGDAHRWLEDQQ